MQTKKRVQRFRKRQKQQYELLVKNKKNRDAVRKCRSGVLHANKWGKYKLRVVKNKLHQTGSVKNKLYYNKFNKVSPWDIIFRDYEPWPEGTRGPINPNLPYYFKNGRAFKLKKRKRRRYSDKNILFDPESTGLTPTPLCKKSLN